MRLRQKGISEEQAKLLPEGTTTATTGVTRNSQKKFSRELFNGRLLAYHLQGEYGKDHVAEWGYNILAACEKHIYDADIELFYLC